MSAAQAAMARSLGVVARIDPETESLVPGWLSIPETAEALDVDEKHIHRLLRERQLLGFDRAGRVQVPAPFVGDGQVIKGLPGTLTLLADAGFAEAESVRWLFTPDETLPGTPIQALSEDRGKEVKRRAQALGF